MVSGPTFAVAAAACAALATPVGAASPAAVVRFDVPSGPIAQALPLFARQAGLQILAPADGLERIVTPGLTGTYETRAGLRRLIEGTGLTIASDQGRTILLQAKDTPGSSPRGRVIDGAPALLEEVIVTALRRESTASRAPVAVIAIDGRQLETRGAAGLGDLQSLAPGLNVTEINPGQRRLSLRGAQSAGESTVGLYIGDTPVSGPNSATSDPSSITPDPDLFDLERVEILKGPQGTLFGSGSMSGALRLMYNQPDLEHVSTRMVASWTSVAEGGAGGSVHLMANRPLIEGRLGFRAVAYDSLRPGYVDNPGLGLTDVNSVRTRGARLVATLTPSSATTVSAMAMVQDQQVRDANIVASSDDLATDAAARLPFPNRFSLFSLNVRHDFGWARLWGTASLFDWDSTKYIDTTKAALLAREEGRYCAR